jgi:hypothetical protein
MFTVLRLIDGGSKSKSKDQDPVPDPKKTTYPVSKPGIQYQSKPASYESKIHANSNPKKDDLKFVPIDGHENVG